MRELYKYKSASTSTSSAVPASPVVAPSLVARAVAKIEKDDQRREETAINSRNNCQSGGAVVGGTSDPFVVSCADGGGTGECVLVADDQQTKRIDFGKCPRALTFDSPQLSDGECQNISASCQRNCADFSEKSPDDSVGFFYKRLQERTSPYDFETALADFDRTATDVLTFVRQRSDHLLARNITSHNSPIDNQTTHLSSSSSGGEDDGTSDSDSDRADDSSISSKDVRDIVGEGLETIAEECGAHTATGFDETDDSGPEEDDQTPIQLCKPAVINSSGSNPSKGPPWIDLAEEEDLSSTDSNKSTLASDSSTETQDINESKDSSRRCTGDFQWIRKDAPPSLTPNLTMDTDDVSDGHTSSGNNKSSIPANQRNSNTKPPINHKSSAVGNRHHRSLTSPTVAAAAGGSLDRRRYNSHHAHAHRYDRDQKSRSQNVLVKSPPPPQSPPPPPPPKLDDYTTIDQREYSPSASQHRAHASNSQFCQSWCGCGCPQTSPNHRSNLTTASPFAMDQMYLFNHPPHHHHQHQQQQQRRFGSGPILLDMRGSHPDLYRGQHHESNHPVAQGGGGGGCCQCHGLVVAPPIGGCCGYRWSPPMVQPGDLDDRCRKLHSERDNLQLQVQVLSEQIEAQSDKIVDLEKRLGEKKQALSNTEDILQRETISRSSLETQKLELISQISELKLVQASIERENLELRCHYNTGSSATNDHHLHHRKQLPAYLHRMSPQPTVATSTPVHHNQLNQGVANMRISPSPSPVNISNMASPGRHDASPKTPPAAAPYKRHIELHYSSLPRQQYLSNGGSLTLVNSASLPQQQQQHRGGLGRHGGMVVGSQYSGGVHTVAGLRHKGHSVPNLAETEKIIIDDSASTLPVADTRDFQQQSVNNNNNNKSGGMKKLFGKLKRSGSGNLEDLPPGLGVGDFQRGGVRATASPRLGWSEPQITKKPPSLKPFADWETSHLCEWFADLGLDQYVAEARRWLKSGQQLQEASATDYEKELQMKSALHRKKLQLALIDAEANGSSDALLAQAGKLDTAWVLRWLDDVGLPQYKEAFLQQRVDGRVLHRLTMDDLATLHVTSALHAASLRRGIQVLRDCKYDATCLQRRAGEDEEEEDEEDCAAELDIDGNNGGGGAKKQNSHRSAREISLWTSHRVMQWLREVDLAEYAPNLRGAGVHGAIIVLERRFTADLLAALLSISPGKTLLRRHLNTRFKELLGADLIQAKREAEAVLGYVALTPQAKLKVAKKSHFSLKRSKSRSEADYGDLVCPLNATGQSGQDLNGCAINSSMGMTKKIRGKEEDAYQYDDQSNSYPQSAANSPLPLRYESS